MNDPVQRHAEMTVTYRIPIRQALTALGVPCRQTTLEYSCTIRSAIFRQSSPSSPSRTRGLQMTKPDSRTESEGASGGTTADVNGQVVVPARGQLKVPAPRGWFSWVWWWCLLVLGLVSSGRNHHW